MEKKKLTCCDLMIGDWVECNGKFIQVENVHKDMINYTPDIPYVQEEYFIEGKDITPIPLTAEILEKNGIKWLMSEPSGKRTYSCNEPPISCTFIPDRGWYLSAGPVGSTKLPFAGISMAYYVHEIQHALRLCGVDKEITL